MAVVAGDAGPVPGRPPGPNEVLRLAILGVAARGPFEPERLIAAVQALGGRFWRPTGEVVIAALEALARRGLVSITNAGRPAYQSTVRCTPGGEAELADLLRRDIENTPEPLFHGLLGVTIALLDLLPPAERWRVIDRLVDRLRADLAAVRRRSGLAMHFEESRLDGEIRWLSALRDVTAGRIGQPAGTPLDAA